MPSARFSACLAGKGLSLTGIDECGKEFAVSFEAAGPTVDQPDLRAEGLLIATVSRTKKQEHAGELVLRITKWWQSQTWPESNGYQAWPWIRRP